MVDEDLTDAIDEHLMALPDACIDTINHICEYNDGKVDGFYLYDDWGGQKDGFFHPDVV